MTDSIGQFEKKVKSDQNKYNKKKKFGPQGRAGVGSLPKKEDQKIYFMIGNKEYEVEKMAKGGRVGLKGGGICKKGMNKKAIGKNS